MGIRYDRDRRNATNGPVIFFSDASSEMALGEEIRGAIISGLSFYSYRQPGSPMVTFGSSEGFVEGIGIPGFVIGMFSPQLPIITIPYKGGKPSYQEGALYSMPSLSTSEAEYKSEVKEIISILQPINKGKIVAARVKVESIQLDLAEKFFDFCRRFPECYVFCFSTPATGCWIGASPELLLESHGGILRTMALAGTRRSDEQQEWDAKNLEEQQIVTDYILDSLKANGLKPVVSAPFTKKTGEIEHICTEIEAPLSEDFTFNLQHLLSDLSPTPALCGNPKNLALETIQKLEKFQRGCYGGFCGQYHSDRDFYFNVVLRCMAVEQERICIYAGGGITAKSDPRQEWEETESKISNIFP